MTRTPLLTAAAIAAGLALAAPALAGPPPPRRSPARVGPGFTITLTKAGKPVKTLKPGSYKITVADKSSSHNFHILGPGVKQEDHDGAVQGQQVGHRDAQEGQVHVPVRPACRPGMKWHLHGRRSPCRTWAIAGGRRSGPPPRRPLAHPRAVAYAPRHA